MAIGFTELHAGRRFVSPARTLTETDHQAFMMLVGDWHPIHADAEFARAAPFGQRVMHGGFGVALMLGMMANVLEHADPVIGALGMDEWKFRAPLFIGDTVHLEMEILATRLTSDGGRGIVERGLQLLKHDGTLVQSGKSAVLLRLGS